jgi:CheY-like chemotaxis protein
MPRILVVDDEPIMRSLLADVLKRMSYEVILSEDGIQALQVLAQNPDFDAVLSDIRMPKMNGLQLLNALVADYPHLPIILSSVHTEPDIRHAVEQMGAVFLPRPFTSEQLRQVLD